MTAAGASGWMAGLFCRRLNFAPVVLISSRRQYTLEVIQEPVRARMCGFGDKVRSS